MLAKSYGRENQREEGQMPVKAAMVDQMLDHLHARTDRFSGRIEAVRLKEHASQFSIGVSTPAFAGIATPSVGGCTLQLCPASNKRRRRK
jgi:hypothetical protein